MIGKTIQQVVRSRFARDSGVYLAGSVLNAALPFAVVPILTRHLTPTDYGIVGTAATLIQILTLLIGFNSSGLIVSAQFNNDKIALRRLVTTLFSVSGFVALVVSIAALALPHSIERFTLFPGTWTILLVVLAYASLIQNTYLVLLQARHKAGRYIAVQVVSSAISLGMSVLLVVGLAMDWRGRMIAQAAAALVITVAALIGLRRSLDVIGGEVSRDSARQILAFGLPLVPHTAGGWLMALAPRLYLNHMVSLAATGLYSLGANLAAPISMLVGALNQAYMPALFERLKARETLDELQLCRALILGAFGISVIALAWSVFAAALLPWLVGERFLGVAPYLFWLALAAAAQGVYYIFASFVVFTRQTRLIAWRADFVAGLSMVILVPALIRLSGPVGAAQAICAANIVSTVGAFIASRKAMPMPWLAAARSLLASAHSPRDHKPTTAIRHADSLIIKEP